jgi:hypothetical protein
MNNCWSVPLTKALETPPTAIAPRWTVGEVIYFVSGRLVNKLTERKRIYRYRHDDLEERPCIAAGKSGTLQHISQ